MTLQNARNLTLLIRAIQSRMVYGTLAHFAHLHSKEIILRSCKKPIISPTKI